MICILESCNSTVVAFHHYLLSVHYLQIHASMFGRCLDSIYAGSTHILSVALCLKFSNLKSQHPLHVPFSVLVPKLVATIGFLLCKLSDSHCLQLYVYVVDQKVCALFDNAYGTYISLGVLT